MLDRLLNLVVGDVPVEHKRLLVRVFFRGLLVVHVAWACGWLATIGLSGFAQAGEVQKVREELTQQIAGVKSKVDSVEASVIRSQKLQTRTALETEVRRLDQEIFNVEARVKELDAAGLRPDRIYDERLNDLRSERERVQSRLTAFMRANPDIVGATF